MAVRKRGNRWVVRWREGGRGSPAHQKTFTREKDARRFDTAVPQYPAQLRAAGAGVPTVNRCLAVLQGVLQRAVEWRRLPANPAAGTIRLPHLRDSAIDAREPERVEAIRAATLDSSLMPTGVRFRRADAGPPSG